jgi:DNA-binding LacI/PurR family transcriptional regulator
MLDVAKRANVALSTVSYALNGTRPISEETRQRIYNAMQELGYTPHALARGLASKHSHIIALLFSTPERGLGITELEFVISATNVAKENSYHLVLWPSDMNDQTGLQELINQGLLDGVILMEVHLDDQRVKMLREMEFPFSIIGRTQNNDGINFADIDFENSIQTAVKYLVGLGHTKIAFLNHSQTEFVAQYGPAVRAQAGFIESMGAAGLEGITHFCGATPRAGYEATRELLAKHPDLTTLISMNDRALPGVIHAITDLRWCIPDDFSIISFVSSARDSEMMVPPLTTMDSPGKELGRLGVELLLRQLDSRQPPTLSQILIPCALVVRSSTGPAPVLEERAAIKLIDTAA